MAAAAARVGFVGLGNMGLPMARNLVKAGASVVAHDLDLSRVPEGAAAAASPAALAQQCEGGTIFTMLQNGDQVKAVVDAALPLCGPDTLIVDCSTIDPPTARALAANAEAGGCAYVDAPVSGGAVGAEAATLAFMVGATDDAFARAAPLLKHMGKTPIHCGPVGAGLAVKLANNLSLALQMLGTAEAFALGVSQGVDPKVLKAVFDTSSARCWSCDAYNPVPGVMDGVPASRDYAGGFATALMMKDLKLALAAADDVSTPSAEHALRVYGAVADALGPDKDFGAAYAYLSSAKAGPVEEAA
mmetsp:Transcript_1892/g.5596  ORF Transcript_1892/g.5596 Transcript_1892/m.5596 type:complete len:302 (-) Transcript_1892:156-1061(-)